MKTIYYILLPVLAIVTLSYCVGHTTSDENTSDNNGVELPDTTERTSTRSTKQVSPVTIDNSTVNGLIVYYPLFSRIDLVCGTMPSTKDTSVIFCAEAAFTSKIIDEFSHSNINGDHVSAGKLYEGAKCDNSGAFAWLGDTTWEFVHGDYHELLERAAKAGGMGFGQMTIIQNGKSIRPLWRKGWFHYRALCEKDGQLCIVDSRDKVSYERFVANLEEFAPTHALYIDMGSGWNYSWWRDADGKVHEIHPSTDSSRYCTNWITFYK